MTCKHEAWIEMGDGARRCADCKERLPPKGHRLEPVDLVNHPPHYNNHPSGVECITITQHMNFCLGNVIKYLYRVDEKGDPIENLKKARFYLDVEIARREKLNGK